MHVLVVNTGSSSIKFSIFEVRPSDFAQDPQCLLDGELSDIGALHAAITVRSTLSPSIAKPRSAVKAAAVEDAVQRVFAAISGTEMPAVDAVGYRVVHPGPELHEHQRVTPVVMRRIEEAASFAPLHDPVALKAIHMGIKHFPKVPQFVCFDSIFHQTMPQEASIYSIPARYRDEGVHRYGFHGLSCESIVRQIRTSGTPVPRRMVIAHLGSGCSVTALIDGRSVDTTMGLTPTGGVVMGTRPGDMDPGLFLYLVRQQPGDAQQAASAAEKMVNHESGMVALSGLPNDVKQLRQEAAHGNSDATLALKVFTRSITKAIGAFSWLMGGLDALIFAGGIGENDPHSRAEILSGLQEVGVTLNAELNENSGAGMQPIHAAGSATAVFIIPAQEDLMIALHVGEMSEHLPESGNSIEAHPEEHEEQT